VGVVSRFEMLKVLTSWLEDGSPVVSSKLAQTRGEVCAKCPLNVTVDWWEKLSKDPVADVIKKWLEIKNSMKISVPIEKELGICHACGCVLRLKIHEPIKYISEHTDVVTMKKYISPCWILTEQKS
jgi:hypothetical protein